MTSDSHDIKQIRKSYEEKKRIDINPALHDAFFWSKMANEESCQYKSKNISM